MMPEIEEAIRAIVRDEIKKAIASSNVPPRGERVAPRGQVQRMVLEVLASGPMSTPQIVAALWNGGNHDRDIGTLRTTTRNAVWTMTKTGMLVRDTSGPEWTYAIPPAQGIGVDRPEGGVGNPTEPTQSPVAS